MTSGSIFPQRFTKIDDLVRPDHHYLAAADECYFIGEYTARKGAAYSATNQLILNLKKSMDRRGRPEWPYKARAIKTAAGALRAAMNDEARKTLTFVPVPPSKSADDPLYDDRLAQTVRGIWPGLQTDLRELVVQPVSTDAVHASSARPPPAMLEAGYVLNSQLLAPPPHTIAIFDDILTTGSHFVAVRNVLRREFPDAPIVGLFIARRVPEAADFADFFESL
jgi:hypothetical protein